MKEEKEPLPAEISEQQAVNPAQPSVTILCFPVCAASNRDPVKGKFQCFSTSALLPGALGSKISQYNLSTRLYNETVLDKLKCWI